MVRIHPHPPMPERHDPWARSEEELRFIKNRIFNQLPVNSCSIVENHAKNPPQIKGVEGDLEFAEEYLLVPTSSSGARLFPLYRLPSSLDLICAVQFTRFDLQTAKFVKFNEVYRLDFEDNWWKDWIVSVKQYVGENNP
jgi:hypothetical protein